MVMIVKDHRKQAHGFISVTRLAWRPRRPAGSAFRRPWRRPATAGRASAHGGGPRSLAAAMAVGPQSPHFCLRRASLGAVPLFRGSTGADKGPPAVFRLANPEPAGAGLGDQAGQPGNGPGRVPVSGRTALYQVNVPLLVAIV